MAHHIVLKKMKERFTVPSFSLRPQPTVDDDTSLIQLIDGKGKFNVTALDAFSEMVRLRDYGLSYAVVSIIGPQSSGKSTLLNHLFGTTFREMDAYEGRNQTTKGIWLSKAADIEPCTMVIDVEGSDGMQRGESTLFEKQSALFALAVSDVVLVNMWCTDLGRENGGGRPLLRTVFEKILSLTTPRKMTLLFVLRDPTKTPLQSLEVTLMASIQEIYDSVPKPEKYRKTPLNIFFDVLIISLPSYQHVPAEFKQEAESMKEMFINSTAPTGLIGFQEDKVPASEISFSLQKIWNTIKENKDLDLPAHKVMVATVRCDEIIKESLSDFFANQDWCRLEKSLKAGPVLGFGKAVNSILTSALSQFDEKVAYFDEGVRIFKRQSLLDKLLQLVKSANDKMLEHLYAKAVNAFREKFDKSDRTNDQLTFSINDCTNHSLSIFDEGIKDMENAYITSSDTSKVYDRVQRDIGMYITLANLQASVAESDAARDGAFAMVATVKADAAKAVSDVKTAAAQAVAAQVAAAHAAADSKAAAEAEAERAVAQKVAAEMRAAAAERAINAAQEAAKIAEEEAIRNRKTLMGWIKAMIQKGFSSVLDMFGVQT